MNEKIKAARKELGGFFKSRREELNLNAEQVASEVGITPNTLRGIETGRFAWDIDLHYRLCSTLNLRINYGKEI